MEMNNWVIAEEATHKVIQKVQPASVSEEARREVVDYIQKLVKDKLGIEVYAYGSMPLKTYLSEGDIDFTAFCDKTLEFPLANKLKCILEEEKNISSRVRVKDAQLVLAQVKLVKCIVQDIVVDISFNQIGGVNSLCFLEQMDRLIGKCHLFKRSIILIKAWFYYESRILGAQYCLVATYALEILVLHIFYLYHSKLEGPLAALYTFLDYYSKFDWETYCVSLCGPVRISSLPDIVVDVPDDTGGNLLLDKDFLSSCIKMFSVPSKGRDPEFMLKHLNIIDPLKTNNNLGRSVNKGNYYRINSAFTYGIKKLRQILLLPANGIASELHNFFKNTMRHGVEQQPENDDYDTDATKHLKNILWAPNSSSLKDSEPKTLNFSTDLTGDFDRFLQCLENGYGQLYKHYEVCSSQFPLASCKDQCISENYIASELQPEDEYNACATRHLKDILLAPISSSSKDPKPETPETSIASELHKYLSNTIMRNDGYNEVATRHLKDILWSSPSSGLPGTPESLNLCADFNGDFGSSFQSLDYGQICDDYELWLSQRTTFAPCAFHYVSEQQSTLWSPYWQSSYAK